MERRSRSTSRKNGDLSLNTLNREARHASIGRSFPELPNSLVHRGGGDSRTLSPERKPHHYGFPKTSPHHSMNKSGSYNVYTQGQPPPIPPPHGLSHAASAIALGINGTNPVPTPPRAPIPAQRPPKVRLYFMAFKILGSPINDVDLPPNCTYACFDSLKVPEKCLKCA